MWKFILTYLLVVPLSIFSLEFCCPYGICDDLEENKDFTKIAKALHKLLKKTGFESETEVLFGGESYANWETKEPSYLSYDFLRESNKNVLGTRHYYARHSVQWNADPVSSFDVSFGEEEDCLNPYFERIQTSNTTLEQQTTSYLIDSFHESVSLFSQLRNDLKLYVAEEISYYQLKIQDLNRDLTTIGKQPSWPDPDRRSLSIQSKILETQYKESIESYLKKIDQLNTQLSQREKFIDSSEHDVSAIFKRLYQLCLENHENMKALYELSLIDFHEGNDLDAFFQIKKLINATELEDHLEELLSDLHLLDGKLCNELSQFHEAIETLTRCIEIDPDRKDAYFERAVAYFETGQLEIALQDYLQSEIKPESFDLSLIDSLQFSLGLTKGATRGGIEGLCEFVPSMLSSAGGLAHGLWAFAKDPIQVSKDLILSTHACLNYIREHSTAKLLLSLVPELQTLIKDWDTLSHAERGEMTGYVIGKYGIDIFAGAGTAKAMKAYRDLKRANNMFTLEAAARSSKNYTEIASQAHKRIDTRTQILQSANLKIHADKQGKHITGHRNFNPLASKSIFEHPDPQGLVNRFAGKGYKANSIKPGSAGYKEVIDFKEFIGYNISESSKIKTPTTWGTVHYANDGVHIVPTAPRKHGK